MRSSLLITSLMLTSLSYADPQEQRHKGYSGFSEITLETANTHNQENDVTLEQWNEIIYRDLNTQKEIGTQFSFKLGKQNHFDTEIYQLYLKQPFDSKTLTVGRFEQIDARGFYTLNGFSLKPSNNQDWWFFMGKPKRIDAYEGVDGGWLLGAERHFTYKTSKTQKQQFRIGFQQQWNHGNSGSYLNLSTTRQFTESQIKLTRMNISGGVRLDETALENFIAKAEFDLKEQGYLYLSYDHYRPPEKSISFHNRFYQSYALKQQSVLRGDWHKKLNPQTTINLQARQVWHEVGNNGQGLALGLRFQPHKKDWQAELRGDIVRLKDNQSITIYSHFKQPLTSVLSLELEGMIQQKETLLTDKDNSQGIAFKLKHMLGKNLNIEASGEYINHSDAENEYKFSIGLRRDFHTLPFAKKWGGW